jgi:hypothetical protein
MGVIFWVALGGACEQAWLEQRARRCKKRGTGSVFHLLKGFSHGTQSQQSL